MSEKTEKVRQAIMRWRELLDILEACRQQSEANYQSLFERLSPNERATLKEKDQQWTIAAQLVDDPEQLKRALLKIRLSLRGLERDFDETYNNLVEME
jgi:hypothetical protein